MDIGSGPRPPGQPWPRERRAACGRWQHAVAVAGATDTGSYTCGSKYFRAVEIVARRQSAISRSIFSRFFNVPENRAPQVSAGSGVIVDAVKGHVLTNKHVIKNAQQILVTLKDRRQLEAKLV